MAVVINDMEVAPQPAEQGSGQTPSNGGGAGSPDKLKQLEKSWHKKRQRVARLEAY
ncbi:MAG TPA: hypothetical protein VKU19_37205 [Bryobacteraceae bacterium]|nr:hypothetical protein [Bryobacteraceae bacterium]